MIGWITADGTFFPCCYGGHIDILDTIPEEKRFAGIMVKMSYVDDNIAFFEGDKMTRKQRETIFDLCTKYGHNFDKVTELLEFRMP